MCAGVDVDIVVSLTSFVMEFASPTHSQETVAIAPCDAGGVHISILVKRKADAKGTTVLLATVHTVPRVPANSFTVMIPAKADMAWKR